MSGNRSRSSGGFRVGTRGTGGWRDDAAWQAGFLLGSALGAVATVLGRRAERAARRGLVDWPRAEEFAIQQLRHAPGTLARADIEATEPVYAAAMASIVPRLSEALE